MFAIRTIKNGRVKFNGRYFKPSEDQDKYNGELDGLRYCFADYANPDRNGVWFIAMWGTEKKAMACRTDEEYERVCKEEHISPPPDQIGGVYRWYWWEEVKE
jgi:hypothetical protein